MRESEAEAVTMKVSSEGSVKSKAVIDLFFMKPYR